MRAPLATLAGQLVAAGINATTDVRAVSPPCVLIERPEAIRPTMHGIELDFSLWCIAPRPWATAAWDALDTLVYRVTEELPDNWTSVHYQRAYVMPDGSYPAVEIVFNSYQIKG